MELIKEEQHKQLIELLKVVVPLELFLEDKEQPTEVESKKH